MLLKLKVSSSSERYAKVPRIYTEKAAIRSSEINLLSAGPMKLKNIYNLHLPVRCLLLFVFWSAGILLEIQTARHCRTHQNLQVWQNLATSSLPSEYLAKSGRSELQFPQTERGRRNLEQILQQPLEEND